MEPVVGLSGEPADTIARSLPAYRLVSVVARSAMSVIYLADEPALRRRVALKVLAPDVAQDPTFRSRFAREVEIAAALDHPNVIPIHAAGEAGGLLYLTMRFVEGSDLARIARRGPMSLDETVRIVRQVADALDTAHQAGLVHRDVKPGNVLIDAATGHAYLCDFGIATHAALPDALTRSSTALTQVGAFVGTIDYVAPEQVQGWPVDGRVDVYALGALIFRCLAGSAPFTGGAPAVLWSHVNAPRPSLVQRRPDLPARLDAVLARAMAIDPRARHPTCRALVDDVAAAPVARVATRLPSRRRRYWVVAAAALLVVGLVLAAVTVVPGVIGAGGIGAAERERLPVALRDDCEPAGATAAGATGTVRCQDGFGLAATVGFHDTAGDSDRAYDEAVTAAGGTRSSGDCAVMTGAEHRYPGVGEAAGRVLCVQVGGTARLVWTDREARIVGTAERGDGNDFDLYRSWERWVGVPVFPAAPEQELLDMLDERDCRRGPASLLDTRAGAVALVECDPPVPGARTVQYVRFADGDALRRSYDAEVASAGPAQGGGNCVDLPPAFGESAYDAHSTVLGRVLCHPTESGEAQVTWTADALIVLGQAVGPDLEGLMGWFVNARGPRFSLLVDAVNAQSVPPFPTVPEQAVLDRMPEASRLECMRPSESQVQGIVGEAEVAAVGCTTANGPPILFYHQFADAAAMAASVGDPPAAGVDCTTLPPSRWSDGASNGDSAYARPDGSSGRLRCGLNSNGLHFLYWSDDSRAVVGVAFGRDPAEMVRWWQGEEATLN